MIMHRVESILAPLLLMRMNISIRNIALIISLMGLIPDGRLAWPHALDPESIDRHAELSLTPNRLVLIYELLLGVSPTERAVRQLDADGNKNITGEERNAFVRKTAEEYGAWQIVEIGGRRLNLSFVEGDAYRTIGHNGINVLKIDLGFISELPADLPRETTLSFQYQDASLENKKGWKQIAFVSLNGVRFSGHLPYRDFGKFDYDIIEKKGFVPATDSIRIEISLPNATIAPVNPPWIMPEKNEIDISAGKTELRLLFTLWRWIGGIAILTALVFGWYRWKQSRSDLR